MASAPANTTLLTQSLEAFQALAIGTRTIVITVIDDLPIGAGSDFGSDYSAYDLYLYGEGVTLSGTFRMRGGVVSAQWISPVGNASLSTAGAAGIDAPGTNQTPSTPGARGGNGTPGGNLSLYLGQISGDEPGFRIDASGGAGGAGQRGLLVAPGGNGGDGAAGGAITYLGGLMADYWLESVGAAAKLTTVAAQQQALSSLLENSPTGTSLTPQWATVVAELNAAVTPDATEREVDAHIEQAGLALQGISDGYGAALATVIDVSGGRYGVYGDGVPSGTDGKAGADGSLATALFGAPADLSSDSFEPFFLIHPSECARLLNQAELMYLVMDPVHSPTSVSDLITVLTRLQQRTQLFVAADPQSALITYYQQNEANFGSIGSVQQLIAINGQASAYLSQIKNGQDFFGNDGNAVPLGSFTFYNNALDNLIANFSVLEKAYDAYFLALANNTATMEQIDATRAQQQQIIATANQQIEELTELVQATASVIDSYQTILPPLQAALEAQLQALEDAIKNHFDFNFETFLSAMTSLAFAPESKFMMLTQATSLLYSGMTKITNVQGVQVNKDYIVSQVVAVESSVDAINEGFEQLQNGTLKPDDPGAGKLIAEESSFLQFMAQFEDTFPDEVQDAVDAFNAYVAAVVQRNNQILTYNSALLLIARNQQAIADAQARNASLDQQTMATLSPQLPDMVSYVSAAYYAARNQVLQTLDQTSRAYRFWALSATNLMEQALGSTPPPKINTAVLTSAQNTIIMACEQAVESFGTNAQVFPVNSRAQGVIIALPAASVTNIQRLKQAMYQPVTVHKSTTKADSPFAGMANVRVSLVRAWIDGAATSDGKLTVTVTQSGQEQIVSTGNQAFTFEHKPISKLFTYDLTSLTVIEEANFGLSQSIGSTSQVYAAIGPFGAWQITVDAKYNQDLDLSGVTAVRLEFHGTNYAFS